jgi:signal transduction histidine kinase
MLHDFINDNREFILGKCNAEMVKLAGTKEISVAMRGDWKTFLDQLGELLDASAISFHHWSIGKSAASSRKRNGETPGIEYLEAADADVLEPTAARRGPEFLRMGYTLSDVVHAYGIVCQAVTTSATELKYSISSDEFSRLNLSLDIAIAAAVTEYEKQKIEAGKTDELQRLGFLAHELRNALASAFIALELVESGDVGARGHTGKLLNRSLQSMKMLIDSALLAVRMKVEPQAHLEWVNVLEVASEIEITAAIEAREHVIGFKIEIEPGLEVFADRQHFVSALANILQNAVKFSHPGSIVRIRAFYKDQRAFIEIEDRCGGLPQAKLDALFVPFAQMANNKTGLGLGLTISRKAIELSDGTIYARNLPGQGCIFTIELPGRISA